MRKILADWKNDWLKANGQTHDFEVIIYEEDQEASIYEGCFLDIPFDLLDSQVLKARQILASSCPERDGAYSLVIQKSVSSDTDKKIEKLYDLLEKEKDMEVAAALRWAIFQLENCLTIS